MENEREKQILAETETKLPNAFSSELFNSVTQQRKEFEKQKQTLEKPMQMEKQPILKQNSEQPKALQNVISTPNYDMIEVQDTGINLEQKNRMKKKFRFKLATGVYCLIFALCASWVVANTIEIFNQTSALNQAKTTYEINLAQYQLKIEQLDGYQTARDGNGNIVTTIVDVEPQKLAEPTQVQPITNFFDRLCNWLTKIFGG